MRRNVIPGVLTLAATAVLLILTFTTLTAPVTRAQPPEIRLALVADGISLPTDIASTGLAGDGRLFVTTQGGQIRIINDNGDLLLTPFLDISAQVNLFGENGLLGLTFDPDYANNGYFYVYYTEASSRDNRLSRFQANDADFDTADPNSEQILLTIDEPQDGHNGGDLNFGPDGYLYVAVGDGGLDHKTNAQDRNNLLGAILRIAPGGETGAAPDCGGAGYRIPAGNPFSDGPGGDCDEIWLYGLRNPWRFSFDAASGNIFIADVGENQQEEVNVQPAEMGGLNFGWPCYEGNAALVTDGCGPVGDYTFPTYTYVQDPHCSITGGYVYRGSRYPVLYGRYLFADFCSGNFWQLVDDGGWQGESLGVPTDAPSGFWPTSFGIDNSGELYVADLTNDAIFQVRSGTAVTGSAAIGKTGPDGAAYGALISYTLTVSNTGPVSLDDLVITDTIPTGAFYVSGGVRAGDVVRWDVATLDSGAAITVGFAVTATQTITNHDYWVRADGGVKATGSQTVVTTVEPPEPALAISKRGPAAAVSGETLTYTLTVANTGPLTATNLLITDTLPVGVDHVSGGALNGEIVSWSLAALGPDATTAVQLVVLPTGSGTRVVRNESYSVAADGGYAAGGQRPVVTIIDGYSEWLPVVRKE